MNTILLGWPYLGLLGALALTLFLALERRPASAGPRWQDPALVLPLLWPMYLLHQFEEHGIDLLGRHYAFLADLCAGLGHAGDLAHCPADEAFIFAVNAVGCQLAFALTLVFRRRSPLVAACAWGIPIVNAAMHIGRAVRSATYNPGVLTSVILVVPLSAWMLRTVLRAGVVRAGEVWRSIGTGAAVHVVLMGSLVLHDRGALPREAMLLVNALNGLWPLAFGLLGARRAALAGGERPAAA